MRFRFLSLFKQRPGLRRGCVSIRVASVALVLMLLVSACALATTPTQAPVAASPPPATQVPEPTLPPPTKQPTAEPLVLTDGLGREVVLPEPAQRIVSLAPSNTEILFAIGAGDRIVGADPFSDYPPEAESIPRVDNFPNVNTETVVALEPDLVLAAGITNPDDIAALEQLGLTVYAIGTPADIEAILASILTVGQLTGNTAQAEQVVTDLRARLEAVAAKVGLAQSAPKVFYEIDDSDPAKPWTAGPGSFTDVLISLAGSQNIGAAGQDQYFQISLEEIVSQDPRVIIFSHSGYSGRTTAQVLSRSGWENILAIKNGAVFPIDADIVDRPGPRILDGLEALAKMIHPELFE